MSDLDELLPRRLDGLQDDLTSMRLRPADGVRRRAAQRSRRQSAVAAIGTLAVAGVVGVAALQALPGSDRSQPALPAGSTAPVVVSITTTPTATPTPSISPTPSLSPTPTPDPAASSASARLDPSTALLPASALPRTLPKIDTAWLKPERSTDGSYWEQETARVFVDGCWRRPLDRPRQEIVGTYGSDYMADAVEVVALAADAGSAGAAYDALRADCQAQTSAAGATMPSAGGRVVRLTDLTGGDQGFQVTLDAEENGEVAANVLTVLRQDDRLVLLLFRDVAAVSDLDVPALTRAATEALDRVRP
jgi:hypothetical protein